MAKKGLRACTACTTDRTKAQHTGVPGLRLCPELLNSAFHTEL